MRSWKLIGVVACAGVLIAGCLGPGTYLIAPTLQNGKATAGLWHSTGGPGCYWERLDPFGQATANSFSDAGPQYVAIQPTDAYFRTDGCGAWVQADGPLDVKNVITSAGQFPGDGEFRVGPEIPPGNYIASGVLNCYWERLSSFIGSDDPSQPIIQNAFGGNVTIAPTDVGFNSSHCGVWTKVG